VATKHTVGLIIKMYQIKSILIIEDDLSLALSLKDLFRKHFSFKVQIAQTVAKATQIIDLGQVELIIADWILANSQTSLEIIKYVRENFPQTKLMMLTQKTECNDRIKAYKIGADAYLCKPFNSQELLLLVSKLINSFKVTETNTLSLSQLKLHLSYGEVEVAGEKVHLRPKEMEIFKILIINHPHIISTRLLLDSVWPNIDAQPSHNTVEVYIRRLRQLLRPYGVKLKNRKGYGYYLSLNIGSEQ